MNQPQGLADVLAGHVYEGIDNYGDDTTAICHCGQLFQAGYEINDVQLWADHVAADPEVRAAVLREAAGSVDLSGYYDPSLSGGISTSCHLAENAARDWLVQQSSANPTPHREAHAMTEADGGDADE